MAQSVATSFFKKTTLYNLSNEKIKPIQMTGSQPFVFIFFNTDCPICQKYAFILRGIADTFLDVKFMLVFSKWDSLQAIKSFETDFITTIDRVISSRSISNAQITLLWDKKNKLIKKLKATTTPEVFFFNKNGQLQYQGAIDNWFYALGKYRPEATEHYLKNALTQYLKNEQISIPKTNPIGCLIEY
jgi:hypothetical protein